MVQALIDRVFDQGFFMFINRTLLYHYTESTIMTYAELINDTQDIRQSDNDDFVDAIATKIVDYVIANNIHIENFDFRKFFLVIER